MEPFAAVFIEDGEWIGSWVDQVPGAVAQERTFEEGRESLSTTFSPLTWS
jgi:hypothetical protein